MNRQSTALLFTLVLFCTNVFSAEFECDLSKYQRLIDAHVVYTPTAKKKVDLSYTKENFHFFFISYQFPLSEAPDIWNERKIQFTSDDILEFVYHNFRFQALEEYIFMNTELKEQSASTALGLEGKEYVISAWHEEPLFKTLYKLWVAKDKEDLFLTKVYLGHSTNNDAELDEAALKSEFQNYINSCSINRYDLPIANIPST